MEPSNGSDMGHQGQSANHSLQAPLAEERSFANESVSAHSYFETSKGVPGGEGTVHGIPTIPEGSAVRATDVPKCPSPQTSSAPTTGTTTTPTSIENVSSSGEAHSKGPGPQFPTESMSSSHQSVPSASSWGVPSMSMYDSHSQPQQAAYDPYQDQTQNSQSPQQQPTYNPAHYPAALKLLVSNNVAGSIIGRSGQTISELQSQSLTRIKLSQTGDFYPGTHDRVCLVQGEPDNVKAALRLLLERLYVLQEHQHSQQMAWQLQMQKSGSPLAFDFVIRLLVPSSCCGMIIGKSGSNIKFLEETTGVCSVRLSPKDTSDVGFPAVVPATSERIVTIMGPDLDSCVQCLYLIIDGMLSHPDICRYTNMTTSYSRILPDSYVAAGAARPVLVSSRHSSPEHQLWENIQATPVYGANIHPRRIASSPDLSGIVLTGIPPEPQTPDRLGGYATGHSGAPFPSPGQLSGTPTYTVPQLQLQGHLGSSAPGNVGNISHTGADGTFSGFQHSASAPDLLSFHLEQFMHISTPTQLRSPTSIPLHPHQQHSASHPTHPSPPPAFSFDYSEGFVPQAPTLTGLGFFSAQVLVPDTMIGSILGRGGRALTELQMLSGTRIRISQRGEYMPGTRSRIVTIRGPTAQTVWQAEYMMSQRMVLPPTAESVAAGAFGGLPTSAPTGSPYPSPTRASSHRQQPKPQHATNISTTTTTTSSPPTSSPPTSTGAVPTTTAPPTASHTSQSLCVDAAAITSSSADVAADDSANANTKA